MNSSFYPNIYNTPELDQLNTLPYNFYDQALFSKIEQPVSSSSTSLEQFACATPPTTWDRQQHDQISFPNLFFPDLSLPTYDSPEHTLNMLLQEHSTLTPPQPNFSYSASLSSATDAGLVNYIPLSPASINSYDSFDYVVPDNSVSCFPQSGNPSDDHQMSQIYEYKVGVQPEVLGDTNQDDLSSQNPYSHYQNKYVLTPKEQLYLPIERQVQKKSRRRTHPSQLQCTICFKTFSRPYNLKSHQRTHTKERPYCCMHPNCGWTFARPHDLKRHEFLHSGIKPHVCSCGKKFSRSDAFKRHQTVDAGCASQKKRKSTNNSNL